jgi:uncharacterized protein YoxC
LVLGVVSALSAAISALAAVAAVIAYMKAQRSYVRGMHEITRLHAESERQADSIWRQGRETLDQIRLEMLEELNRKAETIARSSQEALLARNEEFAKVYASSVEESAMVKQVMDQLPRRFAQLVAVLRDELYRDLSQTLQKELKAPPAVDTSSGDVGAG